MNGTLVRGGDWEILICVCVPSKQHTKFLQGKEVNFFSKEDETKATVLLFCALLFLSLSLSLSAFFLIRALLSDDEKKNHRARFFFFFFFFFYFFF
jgi:hypothetical protein